MPRKPSEPPLVCEHFVWRLFVRDEVYYADGRTNRPSAGKHSLNTKDRKEAIHNLRRLDIAVAITKGLVKPPQNPPPAEVISLPLKTGWDMYIDSSRKPGVMKGASDATRKRYRPVGDKFLPFCAKRGVTNCNDVTTKIVEAYGRWLNDEDYAEGTIYFELNTLKSLIKWLIRNRHLPENRRIDLPLFKNRSTDTYCYSPEEVAAILALCMCTPEIQWMYSIIFALACTGMRISELAALRWSDIDMAAGIITLLDNRFSGRHQRLGAIRTTKGRRTRRLPIHPRLRQHLMSLAHHADGRVFHGPRGGTLKPDVVRRNLVDRILPALKAKFPTPPGEIGFEHGRLHSFRHYFVSQAFLSGASEGEIRDWVGHTESNMLERYRHLRNKDAQRRMEQINFFGSDDQPGGPVGGASQDQDGGPRNSLHDDGKDHANDSQ